MSLIKQQKNESVLSNKGRKCKAIFLLMASFIFLYVNTSFSFAAFVSDDKAAFSASVTIEPFIDTDYDGIDDNWERDHNLDPDDPDDAYADSDDDIYNSDDIPVTDGLTNLEEYRLYCLGHDYNPRRSNSGIDVRILIDRLNDSQPLDVKLTADVRNNGGSKIIKYEWDFDGNGTYDYSSRSTSVTYKYTASGTHNVKLRVTNTATFPKGNVGVTTATIDVTKIVASPDARVDLTPDVLSRIMPAEVPVAIAYRGGSDSRGVVKYEWDLTGNGEFDFISTKSTGVTYKYNEARPKSFRPFLKATNTEGLSDVATVIPGIELEADKWYKTSDWEVRPKVILSSGYVMKDIKAGDEVTLRGYGIPAGYSPGREKELPYIRKLEWDFESDGIYDYAIEVNNPNWVPEPEVPHTYGAPGIYRATLRATTDLEPPHGIILTATDHILVIVEDSDKNPPEAKAEAEYYIDGKKQTYKYDEEKDPVLEGTIPFRVTFVHKKSSGDIRKFEWDFDGDKRFDWTGTKHNPEDKNKPVYTYTIPGYYIACLRVTDKDGLTDTAYIPVFVSIPASYTQGHASAITRPKENKTIAGNMVTLTCEIFPDDVTEDDVIFQYSADGASWANIAGEVKEVASYMVNWDTTRLSGDYYVRAIVDGIDPLPPLESDFLYSLITVGNSSNADIYEDNSNGTYTKIEKIDPDKDNEIILYNGARIEIPIGAIESNGTEPKIIITETGEPVPNGVGNAIDLDIEGLKDNRKDFAKDITIIMPYLDSDVGGRENDLVILWYNEEDDEWQPLYDVIVYPEENYVIAKINHFTPFGVGFFGWVTAAAGAGGATVGEGNVSYCFIATAAYDSADADDVATLKEFRDRFLLTSPLGERFVNCYYKYSPKIAEYIKDKPILKKITRVMLKPVVKFAKWKLGE